MSNSTGVSPTSAEVEQHIRTVQKRNRGKVSLRCMGRTPEARGIYAVTITDRKVSDIDKQNVVITAGQHGNEESARLVALALIDWLVTPQGRETRQKQKIIILPNVNPDGAELDLHGTPRETLPNYDHGPGGAKTPEGIAVEKVFLSAQPELFVDMHSRGWAGCSFDMTLWSGTKSYTEDEYLLCEMVRDMGRSGEEAGIPQVNHALAWWNGGDLDLPNTTAMAYRKFKSVVLLTENCEHNEIAYPAKVRAAVGLAKLKALLEWGNRRYSKFYYSGYPYYLISGSHSRAVVAIGKTASSRRKSRVAVWRNLDKFKSLNLVRPEQLKHKELRVKYAGKVLNTGAGLQLRAQGRRIIKAAYLNGKKLRPSETNGYYTWKDNCSTFVVAAVRPFKRGSYQLVVDFK